MATNQVKLTTTKYQKGECLWNVATLRPSSQASVADFRLQPPALKKSVCVSKYCILTIEYTGIVYL